LIQAVAGSGKTTTIIEAMRFVRGSSLFLAFNKAIAEDIRRRAPVGEVKTLNALGHRLMADNRPSAQLNSRKMLDIIKSIMGEGAEFKDYGYTLARVCGLAKNCGFGLTEAADADEFTSLIEAYAFDIPFDFLSRFSHVCAEAFERSRLDTATFDFDDQLWVPVYEGWEFPAFSNVFVDECQDLSPIQHIMLERLAGHDARLVCVGDSHQAIYGFRGATQDSMDILKEKFGMLELPLSISYRCSRSVVQAAQAFCPTIRWRDEAPAGSVNEVNCDPVTFNQYMVVCRNNAPLFREILAYVRRHEPCQVLSNFLDSFQSFIRGFKTSWTSDLQAKLDRWYERERDAAQRAGKRGKLMGLTDKYQTCTQLCKEFTKTEDMLGMVKQLGESRRGPIFATIHKSKGLESPHVYILRPDLFGFMVQHDSQQQQEDNLHYVAITRAKETLTYGASRK
jgi:superfamily I DNA/RNA helicase